MWNIKRYNTLCSKKFEDLHILRGKLDPVQPGDDMIRFLRMSLLFPAQDASIFTKHIFTAGVAIYWGCTFLHLSESYFNISRKFMLLQPFNKSRNLIGYCL